MRMRVSMQVCVRTGLLLLHGWCLVPLHIEFAQRGGSSHFPAAVKQQGGWVVERVVAGSIFSLTDIYIKIHQHSTEEQFAMMQDKSTHLEMTISGRISLNVF